MIQFHARLEYLLNLSCVGVLPPSHRPGSTRACLWCRSSPEFPCPSVCALGWSTWYLCANNPTSCACSTKLYRCSSTYFSTSAGPLTPTASSCSALPPWHLQLTQQRLHSLAVPPCALLLLYSFIKLERLAETKNRLVPRCACPGLTRPLRRPGRVRTADSRCSSLDATSEIFNSALRDGLARSNTSHRCICIEGLQLSRAASRHQPSINQEGGLEKRKARPSSRLMRRNLPPPS